MNAPATATPHFPQPDQTGALLDEVLALRAEVAAGAEPWMKRFTRDAGAPQPGLANLAHYLAFRRKDRRELQRQLMRATSMPRPAKSRMKSGSPAALEGRVTMIRSRRAAGGGPNRASVASRRRASPPK